MRPTTQTVHIETNVVGESQVFSIAANGNTFRTIVDGLYSNKEQSIVRELCANAWDAQKRVGSSRAFFVRGPVLDDQQFSVRDYGIGMDHKKVMTLYTTMFMSDKSETNDQVGMFGLGSKSPFSYTDQFNLTCYDGKIARFYTCSIGDAGLPQINLMQEVQSDEPRGVLVSFHVRPNDHHNFRNAIESVSLAYDPVFETNLKKLPAKGEVAIQGKGWQSYTNSHLPAQWCVRQGCVIYPLTETSGLVLPRDSTERHYLLECPIGTIQVTASRETIAYKEAVVEYLKDRLEHILHESAMHVREQTADIKNVQSYFHRINQIKPTFVDGAFEHPATGLTKPEVEMIEGAELEIEKSSKNYKWFSQWSIKLQARGQFAAPKTIYIVENYEKILDPLRTTDKTVVVEDKHIVYYNFTKPEMRKLTLRCRGYTQCILKEESAEFWIGFELKPALAEFFYPNVTFVRVDYTQMPTGIVRGQRINDKEKTSIYGVSLAQDTSGKHNTISADVVEPADNVAWVTAQHYREKPNDLRVLGRKFGITKLYVANARAFDAITKRGVKKLEEHIGAHLREKHDIGWEDLLALVKEMNNHGLRNNLLDLTKGFLKDAPDKYEEIARTKTILAPIFRALRRVAESELFPMKWETERTLQMMNRDPNKYEEQRPCKPAPDLAEAIKLSNKLNSDGNMALHMILTNVRVPARNSSTAAEKFNMIAKTLIAVAKIEAPL